MMGVPVTDLPLSLSDDNINLGDKDSVRRRALWALEGKSDNNDSFKVEIPDISIPEINKNFDIPSKSSFPPSTIGSGYGGGLNNVAGKRDSFGKHLASSSSAKELLHTLVEEDEEEEDKENERDDMMLPSSPIEMSLAESTVRAVVVAVPTPTPLSRPRPASLNLRPLSLNKENIIGLESLPTPTPTPRSGLRSLTLASSGPSFSTNNTTSTATNNNRRQSLIIYSPATPDVAPPSWRPSLNLELEGNFDVLLTLFTGNSHYPHLKLPLLWNLVVHTPPLVLLALMNVPCLNQSRIFYTRRTRPLPSESPTWSARWQLLDLAQFHVPLMRPFCLLSRLLHPLHSLRNLVTRCFSSFRTSRPRGMN
jgi:hypothetical protein